MEYIERYNGLEIGDQIGVPGTGNIGSNSGYREHRLRTAGNSEHRLKQPGTGNIGSNSGEEGT